MKAATINRFIRFQLNSVASTVIDFTVTVALTELAGLWYLISTTLGTISGGAANFLIARNWVFRVRDFPAMKQLGWYFINWCCSCLLNILSVFVLTSLVQLNYIVSKIITAVLVGILFNYNFQRRYVFSIPQNRKTLKKNNL